MSARLRTGLGCCMLLAVALQPVLRAEEPGDRLAGTKPLTLDGDMSVRMRAGFDRFLDGELERSVDARQQFWQPEFSSAAAYRKSVSANRSRLRTIIGAIDARVPVSALELVSTLEQPALVAETKQYRVFAVRWPVFGKVHGEGLLLEPKGKTLANVVAIPDADQTPEMLAGLAAGVALESQFARRLAESGCRVVVPLLIDRSDEWSGHPDVWYTNHPHREWVYGGAYEMGRHIIGYEVQKVQAVVDWFVHESGDAARIGVVGYGEGGLIGFYAAAIDSRIDGALVSGYFDSRQNLWQEPISRNVFGLLREFGDAEIAALIAPRSLVIEYSDVPIVAGPPAARSGRRASAAPGRLQTPDLTTVKREIRRVHEKFPRGARVRPDVTLITLIKGDSGQTTGPGSRGALVAFLTGLGVPEDQLQPAGEPPQDRRQNLDPLPRQKRQVEELVAHTMGLLALSHHVRENFWAKASTKSVEDWQRTTEAYRETMWNDLVGRFPSATLPPDARTRKIYDRPKWTGYEVVLQVYPEVISWGYLLVPNGIKPGERRPVVVCQHGLEGLPDSVVTEDPNSRDAQIYEGFAAKLADRGFVTYAPHNFYRGGNAFRQLQRKANPLGKTLFAITTIQHQQHLNWLSSLPFVDAKRIGFYGLSYGGNTAMRVPALLTGYAAVIASGDFNEWATKSVSVVDKYAFPFHGAYEVWEWNLGHTFNHSDMAGLIAPRPFMVERGHNDGVAPDEWVAAEYARVRRLYTILGIPERTRIEFFNGPHKIHGVGTFEFLDKHLRK